MTPESLPEAWTWRLVQDIGKVVTGGTPSTAEARLWGGDIPFVTPTDLGRAAVVRTTARTLTPEGSATARLLPARSVLVTCIASIGKNALASKRCCTNQQINAVICNELAWPEYVYFSLCHRTAELQRLAGKTAVPIVSKGKFEQFGLPLPPLPEQRKIAAILTSVDEAIEGTQAVIEQLQVVKKAMMAELFDSAWTRAVHCKLGDVAGFSQGIQVPVPEQSLVEIGDKRVRFIRISDYTSEGEPEFVNANETAHASNL